MTRFIKSHLALLSSITVGIIYLASETSTAYSKRYGYEDPFALVLFPIAIILGFILGKLLQVPKSINIYTEGLRGIIIFSIFYVPLFISAANNNPESSGGLSQVFYTWPGLLILNGLLGSDLTSYPSLSYYIILISSGVLTLIIIFLICVLVSIISKEIRRMVHRST